MQSEANKEDQKEGKKYKYRYRRTCNKLMLHKNDNYKTTEQNKDIIRASYMYKTAEQNKDINETRG